MGIDSPTPPSLKGPDSPTPPSRPGADQPKWPQKRFLDINILAEQDLKQAEALEAAGKTEEAEQLRKGVETLRDTFLKNREAKAAAKQKARTEQKPPETVEQIHEERAKKMIKPPEAETPGSKGVRDAKDANAYLEELAKTRRKAGIPEPPAVSRSAPTKLMAISDIEAATETVQMDATKLPAAARPEELVVEGPKPGLARRAVDAIKKSLGL